VDHGDWAVGFVDTAEQGQGDGVVPAECDDARECLAGFADTWLVGGGEGCAGEEGVVSVFDLLQRVVVVVAVRSTLDEGRAGLAERVRGLRSHGDVAAVDDFAPEVEGVGFHGPIQCQLLLRAVGRDDGGRTHYTRH
jgi:hypothetical protein